MRKIAIITARGGSKGLPDKNMLMVDGRPLLGYTIEAALQANIFEHIILSTDSDEYIDMLQTYPIDFHRRPDHLATDTSSSFDVIEDVLMQAQWQGFDYFVLLQPTSPMRTAQHILDICADFEAHVDSYDFMTSVTQAHKPTVLTRGIDSDRTLKYFDIDYSRYARQNYLPEYSPNGLFFIAKPEAYLEQKHFYGPRCLAHFMDKHVSVDIDDREDFENFYFLIKQQKRHALLEEQACRELLHKQAYFAKEAGLSFVGDAHLAQWEVSHVAGMSVQNLAFTSIHSQQYLERVIEADLLDKLAPRILLSLGINDLRRQLTTPEVLAERTIQIAKALQAHSKESDIRILECPLTLFRVDCNNNDIRSYNEHLEHLAGREGFGFVRLPESFSNRYGKLEQKLTTDGLNFSPLAYQLLEELIGTIW